MADMVNHPPHYTAGPIECIDAIAAALGPVGFRYYCRGTAIKYAWRAGQKDDAGQDLEKGSWYLNRGARVEVDECFTPDREMHLLDEIATLKQRLQDQERQWLEAQDSLRSEWLKVVDVLSEIVPVIEGETTLGMVKRAKARIIAEEIRRDKAESERAELRTRNEDLMKRLGTEIANEGIRLVAMRIKGERDEAMLELANIDAVLGNRAIFDACKTRADKVALAIMFAKSAVGPLP